VERWFAELTNKRIRRGVFRSVKDLEAAIREYIDVHNDWGRLMQPAPALATEFEVQVRQLQLTPETYVFSDRLRNWCERNRNRFYIPEWLLDAWDIRVDPYFSGAA
jgi:hypothetical protein